MQLRTKNIFSPTLIVGAVLTIVFAVLVNIFADQVTAFSDQVLPIGQTIGSIVNFWAVLFLPSDIYQILTAYFRSMAANDTLKQATKIFLFINTITVFSITYKSLVDTFSAFFNNSTNASITARVFVFLTPLLKGRKKGKPWGVVYDAVTKQPIDPATVTITTFENGVGEYKQTRITDIEGRFSFLVTPGRYIISADKSHYSFPSKIISGTKDGKFDNVYHGEVIEVENPYIINLNIPLDPISYDWNQAVKPREKGTILEFFGKYDRRILLLFGVLSSLFAEVVLGSGLGLILIPIYLFNALFVRVYIQKELWGTLRRKLNGDVVAGVVVKAIRQPLGVVIGSATTDYMGRYFLLMSQGLYTLQVEEVQKEGEPKILARIDNVNVKSGKAVINLDITV